MEPAVLVQQVWARVSEIPIDGDLIRSAGDLAERHALRGYDAIHHAAMAPRRAGLRTSRLPAVTAISVPRPQARLQARSSLTALVSKAVSER